MRGIVETTRGAAEDSRQQSHIAKRNATEADLAAARATYVGKPVILPDHPYARFHCVDVRLDQLHRLIFDLVREDQRGKRQEKEGEKSDGLPN